MRILIAVLTVAIFSGCSIEQESEVEYSFFVAGHIYGNPLYPQYGIYDSLKEFIPELNNQPKMEFGFLTGDVVVKPDSLHWDSLQIELKEFNMPIFIAPGNHDRGLEFEKRFKHHYQSFNHNEDLFILLSPTNWNIEGEQLEFLKSNLAKDSIRNIFIFSHELIWWAPDNKFGGVKINYTPHYPGSTNFWNTVAPLLKQTKKPVYVFAGDVGCTDQVDAFMYYKEDNISLIASGMGGGKNDIVTIVDIDKTGTPKLYNVDINQPFKKIGGFENYKLPSID